jgi:membrane protease YdiL (CAAX protease family)
VEHGLEAAASPEAAWTGLVLVAGGLALAPLCTFLVQRLFPGRRVHFARWGFSHVAVVVVLFYLSGIAFGLFARALVELGQTPVLAQLCTMVLVYGPVTGYIGWLALRLDPEGLKSLGFRRRGQLRAGSAGLVAYFLMLPALGGVMLLWPWLMSALELEVRPQEIAVEMLELSPAELWLAVPLAVLVLPFFEELVFRGFLQPLLVQNLGDRGGVVATSVVFGAVHGPSAFLPICALSLILGGVMLRTQRLAGSFAVHALHNGLMLALLLGVPELRDSLGYEAALLP